MVQCCSTDAAPPLPRPNICPASVAKRFAGVEVEGDNSLDGQFRAVLLLRAAGAAKIVGINAAAHVHHGLLEHKNNGCLFTVVQTEGEVRFIQDGRWQPLAPGDFIVLDASRQMDARYNRLMSNQFSFSLDVAPADLGRLMRMAGTPVDGSYGAGSVASNFIQAFMHQANDLATPTASRLVHCLVDVLCTTARERGEMAAQFSSRHHAFHIYRIRQFLEDNLRDPDLTPTKVAAAQGISRRYLSKLFEDEGVSIARYIRERRLEHCRREIEDPARATTGISRIAFSWGFNSASHFSRAFKGRFGLTPRQARDAASACASDGCTEPSL